MDKFRVVVTDANILINLIHIGQLPLLGALVGFDFVVPDEVVAEILDPEQAGALQEALQAGFVATASIADTEELAIFTALTTSLGKGESACLALAERRGWMIASDEGGAFRREANQRLGTGRLINTLPPTSHSHVVFVDSGPSARHGYPEQLATICCGQSFRLENRIAGAT
jgi:predicted nucleic acid-binding protein